MKKKIIGIICAIGVIALLFLSGVFSVSISNGDFFFTTKYYDSPLSAYNVRDDDKVAKREIGLYKFDEEKALFIGEISDEKFVIAEMNIKDGKYAHDGSSNFYTYNNELDENYHEKTKTKSKSVKWTIVYNKNDVEKLSNIRTIKEYSLSDGNPLFLVIFKK